MKKILFGLSVFCVALIPAQNYPDYYPQQGYGSEYNDDEYFPDEYYYEYPEDYYSDDLYDGYYQDYRRSIARINWDRFFRTHRLSPWQIDQIILLNNSFPTFAVWNSVYRYNPDRWYFDRFYALKRILGPTVFVVFQNNYYHGYSPVVYYQNYNRRHYVRNIYVVPRYKHVNINVYKVNKVQYHQNNPRATIGFQPSPRIGSTSSNPRNNGFRKDDAQTRTEIQNNEPRTRTPQRSAESISSQQSNVRNSGFRNHRSEAVTPRREESSRRISSPRKIERNDNRRDENNSRTRMPSIRNSGQRMTSR